MVGKDRQAKYRMKLKSEGKIGRVSADVSVTVVTMLAELAEHFDLPKKAILERLIVEEHERVVADLPLKRIIELDNHSESARQLLVLYGGNKNKALEAVRAYFQRLHPEWRVRDGSPEARVYSNLYNRVLEIREPG